MVKKELSELGWNVMEIWEHELKLDARAVVQRIIGFHLENGQGGVGRADGSC